MITDYLWIAIIVSLLIEIAYVANKRQNKLIKATHIAKQLDTALDGKGPCIQIDLGSVPGDTWGPSMECLLESWNYNVRHEYVLIAHKQLMRLKPIATEYVPPKPKKE
jgi:hypothetical protein